MIVRRIMKIYCRGGVWYVRMPGEKKRSLKTRDRAEAMRIFTRLKREILMGNVVALERDQKITLDEFCREYERHCFATKKGSTAIRDRYSTKKLMDWIGKGRPLSSITPKDIDQFQLDLLNSGLKKSGVAITMRHIRAAFNQAVKWGYLKTNPVERAAKVKPDPQPPRFYSEDELHRIFTAIRQDQDYHDFVTCLLYTGLRVGELYYLNLKDVDLENQTLTIRKSKTRWRTVPIDDIVIEILSRRQTPLWPKWRDPHALARRWGRLMKRLKMSGRLHDLRHSFASYLAIKGVGIRTIQELLGHKDVSTTMIYSHLSPEHLRSAITELRSLQKPKLKIVK
jgi:integrase